MSHRVRSLLAGLIVLGLAVRLPAAQEDPQNALAGLRDRLRARLDQRIAADREEEAPLEVTIELDRGLARRGGLQLVLTRVGGEWARPRFPGLDDTLRVREVDPSGLVLADGRLTGDLVITWEDIGQTDPEPRTQTFTFAATTEKEAGRLIVRLHTWLGGEDWTLAYSPEGPGWTFAEELETPKALVSWGPFDREFPDVIPDADGRIASRIELAYRGEVSEKKPDPYADDPPIITFDFRLVEGRAGSRWVRTAAQGKHMLGNGTDRLSAYLRDTVLVGRYTSRGDRGEWAGALTGEVLPAPIATAPLLRGEPEEPGLRKAWHLYRQILALDFALRHYPIPIQEAVDRCDPPAPEGDATGYAAAALRYVRAALIDGAEPLRGFSLPEDRRFGPFLDTVAPLETDGTLPEIGDGPQSWRYPGGWRFCGPFPVYDQATGICCPEVFPLADVGYVRTRMLSDAEGNVIHDRTPGTWSAAGGEGALVAAPRRPEASSGGMRAFCWYATTVVESPVDQEVWLALRVRGRAHLWLDDTLVWTAGEDFRPDRPAVFQIPLHQGENRLLLRVGNTPSSDHHYGVLHYSDGYDYRPQGRIPFTSFSLNFCVRGQPGRERGESAVGPSPLAGTSGFRGDRSGRYPEADPPLAFDLEKGINVAWRKPLPRGVTEAVHHEGMLVVNAEPHRVFCLDAATGEQRWQAACDILELLGAESRFGEDALDKWVAARARMAEWRQEARENPDRADALRSRIDQEEAEWRDLDAYLRSQGRRYSDGWAGTTPLVTADAVYAQFGSGAVARFDHTGERRWLIDTEGAWNHQRMGSPLLVDGKLILQTHLPSEDGGKRAHPGSFALLALAAADGAELWRATGPHKRTLVDLDRAVGLGNGIDALRLRNGEREKLLLITGDGAVVDAADGRLLHRDILEIEGNRGGPYVEGDVVHIVSTIGEEAVRLWLDDAGRVGYETLYAHRHASGRGRIKANHQWGDSHWMRGPVIDAGHIYSCMVDNAHVPQHHPCPWVGLDVYDRETGRKEWRQRGIIRTATDPTVPPTVAGDRIILADGGAPVPGFHGTSEFGQVAMVEKGGNAFALATSRTSAMRAPPVCVGKRMYLRMFGELVCIETDGGKGRRHELETMADTLFVHLQEQQLPDPIKPVEPLPADKVPEKAPISLARHRHMPDNWLVLGHFPQAVEDQVIEAMSDGAATRPVAGTEVEAAGLELDWRALDEDHVLRDRWGMASKLNVMKPIGNKTQSTTYYHTILEVPQSGVVVFRGEGNGLRFWLNGTPIVDGDVLQLELGKYPLLMEAKIGRLPPFARSKLFVSLYLRPGKDPMAEYRAWIDMVIANRKHFELIRRMLDGTRRAGRANLYLKHIETWKRRQESAER